jgi:anti-anti-sigma regulatory factor
MKTKVLIASENEKYHINVEGRATFEVSNPLRNLAFKIANTQISEISVNLALCSGMDSTFIGVIAMLGLHAKKCGAKALILNAGDSLKKLLDGLGLNKLFTYSEDQYAGIKNWEESITAPSGTMPNAVETAKTILDSHETLMNLDASNIPRFKSVVEFVKKDLEDAEKDKKK